MRLSSPGFRGATTSTRTRSGEAPSGGSYHSSTSSVELLHRVVFSHRTGEPAHPSMLKLHFPAYWHYDLLAGLRTLAASGSLSDERAGDALELLVEKRGTDGTWRTQGRW